MVFSVENGNMRAESFSILQKSLGRYLNLRGAVLAESGGYRIRLQVEQSVSEVSYRLTPEVDGVSILAGCDCDVHAAMGHLMNLLDVREQSGFTPLTATVCHTHKKSVRGMYFATHFFNFYHSAPLEEIYEVIEDLALQGCNNLLVWFDMHHFASMQDPEAIQLGQRLKKILSYGKRIGMGSAMTMLSNESFADSPVHLRAQWEPRGDYRYKLNGHFHIEICPSTEEGMAEILRQRKEMLEYFQDLEMDYLVYWPYDQGGCTCEKCEPWGTNGFLKILPHFQALAKDYFPNAEVIVSTWDFDGFIKGEWDVLYRKLEAGELKGIQNVMAYFHNGDLPQSIAQEGAPKNIRLVDFPEISMHSTTPWGGYGGVLDMEYLQRSWCEGIFDGGYPYSEGIYECVNKFIVLTCFYSRRYKTVEEALRGFIRQYFCCDEDDLFRAMALMQHSTVKKELNAEMHFGAWPMEKNRLFQVNAPEEDILFIRETFEKYQHCLPEKITSNYMFRMFYLRSVIDWELMQNEFLISKSEAAQEAVKELEAIYHTSEQSNAFVRPPVV